MNKGILRTAHAAAVFSLMLLCMHVPLYGIFPASPVNAHYVPLIRRKSPVKWSADTEQNNFQARLGEVEADFPFSYGFDGYRLSFAPMKGAEEEYEAILFNNSGQIVQRFACGRITQPVQLRYDDLTSDTYPDLEIFPEGGASGSLFAWDWENGRFTEEPVEIPKYDEFNTIHGVMVTSKEQGAYQEKVIHRVEYGRTLLLREWKLNRDSGELKIWDSIEKRSVFEGKVKKKEEGELLNEKYYLHLFWYGLPVITDSKSDPVIRAWIEKDGASYREEYQNKGDLLSAFEFQDQTPAYQYYDLNGNLQLELYLDAGSGTACGIRYRWYFTDTLEKAVSRYGFVFDGMQEASWQEPDPFDTTSVYGSTGENQVTDYQEFFNHTEDGLLDSFRAQGMIEWLKDAEPDEVSDLLEINFVYRVDNTLFYRNYKHNPYVFGSTRYSIDSFYDESGRLVYEDSYITHGRLEMYYIYPDGGDKPAYSLHFDQNLGDYIPISFNRYK